MEVKEICKAAKQMLIGYRWVSLWLDMAILTAVYIAILIWIRPNHISSYSTISTFYWCIALLVYFPTLESIYGFTIGKRVVGIKVVDENGEKPTFCQCMKRGLTRLAEANPILLGGIPAGIIAVEEEFGQRWGDKWAKTFVVPRADLSNYKPRSAKKSQPDWSHPHIKYDPHYATYYVWTSFFFIQYMKHFKDKKLAVDFLESKTDQIFSKKYENINV